MFTDFLAQLLGTFVLVAVPTAIVYWRNDGKLSVGRSYLRGLLHLFRVIGWAVVVFGTFFALLSVASLLGAKIDGFPWWFVFFGLGFAGLGYGIQRLMRFILRDEDWNNMFAWKDR